ncbi:EamA family transporter OS=Lysinibacillus sphaericus OX=1421 GN=LS41612_14180 PE=3 SV=1 [Lysinibacillus sphaericus]
MNVSAIIKLTVSMAIFGSIGFFTIHTGLPATELVFIRCVCATLFLGALWLITGGHKTEVWNKKELLRTLLCGVFIVLNWVFLFKAFEEMSISIAISIYNLAPIFVLILGALLLKDKNDCTSPCRNDNLFYRQYFYYWFTKLYFIYLNLCSQAYVWALLSALFLCIFIEVNKPNDKKFKRVCLNILYKRR